MARERWDRHKNSPLEKDENNRITSGHPFPMRMDGPAPDAQVREKREEHPDGSLDNGEEDKKPGTVDKSHPDGDRGRDEGPRDVQPTDATMDMDIPTTYTIRELHGPEKQRHCAP